MYTYRYPSTLAPHGRPPPAPMSYYHYLHDHYRDGAGVRYVWSSPPHDRWHSYYGWMRDYDPGPVAPAATPVFTSSLPRRMSPLRRPAAPPRVRELDSHHAIDRDSLGLVWSGRRQRSPDVGHRTRRQRSPPPQNPVGYERSQAAEPVAPIEEKRRRRQRSPIIVDIKYRDYVEADEGTKDPRAGSNGVRLHRSQAREGLTRDYSSDASGTLTSGSASDREEIYGRRDESADLFDGSDGVVDISPGAQGKDGRRWKSAPATDRGIYIDLDNSLHIGQEGQFKIGRQWQVPSADAAISKANRRISGPTTVCSEHWGDVRNIPDKDIPPQKKSEEGDEEEDVIADHVQVLVLDDPEEIEEGQPFLVWETLAQYDLTMAGGLLT